MKVAINGFGRIGRQLFKILNDRSDIELIKVNDTMSLSTAVHLVKYDSIHGKFNGVVEPKDDGILTDKGWVQYSSESELESLSWEGVDVLFECTGLFKNRAAAQIHQKNGAKMVLISAPSDQFDLPNICYGINESQLKPGELIVSNASCTTNSAAPLIKVVQEIGSIESAFITTVHSYTTDQKLHDTPHKDLRRARAGATSIIPTTTGAAKALTRIFPNLNEVLGGAGIRVPVPDGSLTDMTFIMDKHISVAEVNKAFMQAAKTSLKGILEYTTDPIVSVDVIGNRHSVLYDSLLTSSIGKMLKVVGWYDNEVGYSNRLVDLANYMYKIN